MVPDAVGLLQTSSSEATSKSDATSVLFGLEHEFSVLEVHRVDTATVKAIIKQTAREGPCPQCGVVSGTVKDRPWIRSKDRPPAFRQVDGLEQLISAYVPSRSSYQAEPNRSQPDCARKYQ